MISVTDFKCEDFEERSLTLWKTFYYETLCFEYYKYGDEAKFWSYF